MFVFFPSTKQEMIQQSGRLLKILHRLTITADNLLTAEGEYNNRMGELSAGKHSA